MRRSSLASSVLALGLALPLALQEAPARVTYTVAVVRATGGYRRTIATGLASGPQGTALRLSLRTDTAVVEALFILEGGLDTAVTLTGRFYTARRAGRSRRGLPLWEQDDYERRAPLTWGTAARVYPFGAPRSRTRDSIWVELTATREPAGGGTRPSETLTATDSSVILTLEAVTRPRRAVVALTLVRGDTASAPRWIDLVVDAPARPVELVAGGGVRVLEVGLAPPEPSSDARTRALALDADVVCLRVGEPAGANPTRALCGRLTNVARRLPIGGADTLVATFTWPGAR